LVGNVQRESNRGIIKGSKGPEVAAAPSNDNFPWGGTLWLPSTKAEGRLDGFWVAQGRELLGRAGRELLGRAGSGASGSRRSGASGSRRSGAGRRLEAAQRAAWAGDARVRERRRQILEKWRGEGLGF
jgi:hypothetical protein